MLILSRRIHEVVRISDEIRVHVLGFKGNQVRLGIEAPKEIVVDREEVYLRRHEQALRRTLAGEETHSKSYCPIVTNLRRRP